MKLDGCSATSLLSSSSSYSSMSIGDRSTSQSVWLVSVAIAKHPFLSMIARYTSLNKFAQSNLGRGPRRGAVAHIRRKVPIGYNGAKKFGPKIPFLVDRSPNPTTCLIPGPVRPMVPNGIRIRSAVLPHCTGQTDRPTHVRTDRQTDRSCTGKCDDYRPLRYESDAA